MRGVKIQPVVRDAALWVAVAAAYYYSGRFGLSLAFINTSASVVWPPSGIALAACLLFGYRIWPAIFAGAFLVNLTTSGVLSASVGIAAGNTLEGLMGAYCIQRFARGREAFDRPRDTFKFLIFGPLLSTVVSATAGTTVLCVSGLAGWSAYGPIWLTWWLGDMVSDIVIAPFLISWTAKSQSRYRFPQISELACSLAILFFISRSVFAGWFRGAENYPLEFLCVPFLLWASFRFGPRGASSSAFLISVVTVWGTLHGYGPFVTKSPNTSLLLLQAFIGTITTTMLVLGAVVEQGRRAEKGIRDISLRRGAILNASFDCIISMDGHGKIVDFNPAAEKTFGYSKKEVAGKELAGLIIPASFREAHRRGLTRYLRTGQGPMIGKSIEMTAARSDGSEFPVELAINVVQLDKKPLFTAYLRDLTERRRAEEMFRLVVEAAPTGMVMVNSQGAISLVNSQIEEQFGYQRRELVGQPIEVLVPERFRAKHPVYRADYFSKPALRAMGTGRDLYGLRKDKSEFPVEIGLNPIQTAEGMVVMASVIDITERKKAEEDHLRLAAIVESSEDAIVGKTLSGIITSWNKAAERLYGYKASEILGRSISVLIPPDRPDELPAILEKLNRGEHVEHFETVRVRKDQKQIYVAVTISLIKNAAGQLIGASAIARDITEKKLAQEALIIANKRLAELVSLKDEFVASVSHELRTPLTAIKEGISLVLDRVVGPLNEEQQDFLGTIDESVDRLTTLINNLLDLSKIEAGRFRLSRTRVKLQQAVDTLLAVYKMIAGHRTIRTDVASVPDVLADPDRLLQILGNLFSNAVKFTEDNGTVTISARQEDKSVVISVEDDGIGIAQEDLPKLFTKFSQVGGHQAQGTGLGLALVKQLVEMHQGSIFVTSKPGRGSRFRFTLPVYVPHIQIREENSADAEAAIKKRLIDG